MGRPRDAPVSEAFRDMAESFEQGNSPLYARLARELADDPLVAELAGNHEPRWEAPMRLFAGIHLLELTGEEDDPWSRVHEVLEERRDFLARFVAEEQVQTNEVQRAWALLPAFLEAAGGDETLDLVELGPSAGLNLLWDRYRYRYPAGTWGADDAPLELAGEAEGGPPASLLARRPVVRGRLGIDRWPVDLRDPAQALRLQSFVWADQTVRLERLRRAIEIARQRPAGARARATTSSCCPACSRDAPATRSRSSSTPRRPATSGPRSASGCAGSSAGPARRARSPGSRTSSPRARRGSRSGSGRSRST